MTVLLDTHAFVWAVTSPERLGEAARSAVLDPANDLYVSAATAWELAIKFRLGKFREAEPFVVHFNRLVERLGAKHLAIGHEHAVQAGSLNWDHGDPFDRMLVAQAMFGNHRLVSKDREFSDVVGLTVIW